MDWIHNFEGTLKKELAFLPVRLSNISLNGTAGIAVSIAIDIPTPYLSEVVDACVCLFR
ncbi:MAG: hypothetical protein AB8V97_02480 [Coxiella endosymbiont of Dermacentor nuttalli]